MIHICTMAMSFILSCLLLFGCSESSDQNTVSVMLRADPQTQAFVESVLKDNPGFVIPGSNDSYSVKVVNIDDQVDFKILTVVPEPDVGYTISFIDGQTGEDLPELSRGLGEALRQQLLQAARP